MPLPKNFRNYQAYLAKKKRGPVKAFFHITKNENVPAIEQQGLLANHPNANINSAFQPFRKHGSTGGGVWVTTEPTAFPVYGTTIGGKRGGAEARADALSTFKIEVPVPELPKMLAVQDPYGKNILRKGNDPRAIEPFGTWFGTDVPTTVFLNDMKPAWLKNLGYLEEQAPIYNALDTEPGIIQLRGSWGISPDAKLAELRTLNKSDLYDYSGNTGHQHGWGSYEKSPKRFVDDYLDRSRPIEERRPILPVVPHPARLAILQGSIGGLNKPKRYSAGVIPAFDWTNEYRDYVKPGESIKNRRHYEFAPGAISRGISGSGLPSIKERNFDWAKYKQAIAAGQTPAYAAFEGRPKVILNWDNIGYGPELRLSTPRLAFGSISRGISPERLAYSKARRQLRQSNADRLRRAVAPYISSNADIVRNEFKFDMPDDEIRELARLELRNNKDNKRLSEAVRNWSRLENSDILKRRQRALDKIKRSWLYKYLTK